MVRLWISLTVFALVSVAAASVARGQSFRVQEVVLENGLKVLLLENHKSPAVTFQVWYRVGSRNEASGKSGLSHFLEHMMFKGTLKTAPDEYARTIAKNGGRSNAYTTPDVTVYFATMSRDKIGVAINLEADRMVNALLDGNYFEQEKKVVMEERRLRTEDDPVSSLAETAGATAYLIHPYRLPVIGWMPDIQSLTREDLQRHYKTYYSPNNAFIVVVGDFSSAEILAKIKTAFGKIPRGPVPPKVVAEESPQRGERRVLLKKEAELPFLLFYYHVPNVRNADSAALEVLSVILGSGRSSRLYQDLVYQKRLARSADTGYNALSVDPTLFSVSAQLLPDKETAQVERALDQVIDRVKTDPVTERELEKAKNQVEAAFILGQDSVFGQARRIGAFEMASRWQLLENYVATIRKVTAEDMLRVARKYLDPDRRTVGVLVPTKEKSR
jgi:zinc protease